MPSIFISYKREHALSDQVVRALEKELGDDHVLLRDKNIAAGSPWSRDLYQWLLACDAAIAIVGEESNRSDWCRREWGILAARQETAGLPVFPLHIESTFVTTGVLDGIQGLKWDGEALARLRALLADVRKRTSGMEDFLAAHQSWLRWQFREGRVLGQEPYTLKDVYVETECGALPWSQINVNGPANRLDPFAEANGGRENLIDAVLERMSDSAFRDLIVVQAGPGSGKSAFTLRLANELMERGFLPVLVRFRDLRLATFPDVGELIDDAIRIGLADEDSPTPSCPIVSPLLGLQHKLNGTNLCKAVFILDGWDEVSLTGNVTYQAQLREWLPRLRQYFVDRRGPAPVRVVLTGRPSSEVGESGVLHKATPILTLRPMRPQQLRGYAACIKQKLEDAGHRGDVAGWAIDDARLEPVFANYQDWFAEHTQGKEDAKDSTSEVLGNPLLAYLSLRVIAESDKDPAELLSEPTALYHELIEATVRHAGKGADAGLEETVHRGGVDLRRLLHEVAVTISIRRSESVSYTELEERFEDEDLPIPRELLKKWRGATTTTSALRELVINFYFKAGNTAIGCEFMHKSFREYLFAEAIVFSLTQANEQRARESPSNDKDAYARDFKEGTAEFVASRRLGYLLAPQWLSPEVERHVTWLLQRDARANPERWLQIRDLVTEVYAWWAEGVHLRHQASGKRRGERWLPPFIDQLFRQTARFDDPEQTFVPVRTTVLDAHLGHALMRITNVLHGELPAETPVAIGRRSQYQSRVDGKTLFRPGGGFLHAIIARMDAEGWRPNRGLVGLLSGAVDLHAEDLPMATLTRMDLSAADLSGIQLLRADLFNANLADAKLSGANLGGANLFAANLLGAQLTDARLSVADLEGAILSTANLSHADLEGAILSIANLSISNLRGANLTGANLKGANLEAANLAGANLTGANLEDANLTGTNLTGANLEGTLVSQTALRSARNAEKTRGKPIIVDGPADVTPAA